MDFIFFRKRTELGRGKSVGSETLEMKDMVSAFLTWYRKKTAIFLAPKIKLIIKISLYYNFFRSLFLTPARLAFPLEVVLGRRREKSFQDFGHASENGGKD